MNNPIYFAFGLTLLAGLCTGVGSILSLLYKKFNPKFLGAMLGLSAGVMLYFSFVEIINKARISLTAVSGEKIGSIYTVLGFFGGILVIMLIDKLMPSHEHEEKHHPNQLNHGIG